MEQEHSPHNETTHTSQNWLKKSYDAVSQKIGSAAAVFGVERLAWMRNPGVNTPDNLLNNPILDNTEPIQAITGGVKEFFNKSVFNLNPDWKDNTLKLSGTLSLALGNPIPLLIGAIPWIAGTVLGWRLGARHGSTPEKIAYLGSKLAVGMSETIGGVAGWIPGTKPLIGAISAGISAWTMRDRSRAHAGGH